MEQLSEDFTAADKWKATRSAIVILYGTLAESLMADLVRRAG